MDSGKGEYLPNGDVLPKNVINQKVKCSLRSKLIKIGYSLYQVMLGLMNAAKKRKHVVFKYVCLNSLLAH